MELVFVSGGVMETASAAIANPMCTAVASMTSGLREVSRIMAHRNGSENRTPAVFVVM